MRHHSLVINKLIYLIRVSLKIVEKVQNSYFQVLIQVKILQVYFRMLLEIYLEIQQTKYRMVKKRISRQIWVKRQISLHFLEKNKLHLCLEVPLKHNLLTNLIFLTREKIKPLLLCLVKKKPSVYLDQVSKIKISPK